MSTKKRLVCMALTFLFALAVIFLLNFSATNVIHECTGDPCPVCTILQTAEEIAGGDVQATAEIECATYPEATVEADCVTTGERVHPTPVSLFDVLTN